MSLVDQRSVVTRGESMRGDDSAVLVDDRVIVPALPAGWTNAQVKTSGAHQGLNCIEKVSADAMVTRAYGELAKYEAGRPYVETWFEKTTGDWETKSATLRYLYYGANLIHVLRTWAISANPLLVDQLRIRRITNAEWAAYSDAATVEGFGAVDAAAYPDESHLALLPNTMAKLRGGGDLKMLVVGDSFRYSLSSTPWDGLLMRKYPLCNIIPQGTWINGTGAEGWNQQVLIDGIATNYDPDVVLFGGISSVWPPNATVWGELIGKMKATMPNAEIAIGSCANGLNSTSAAVAAIAAANGVAYYDESTAVNTFAAAAGTTTSALILEGDGTHFGTRGVHMQGRCFGAFFGAVP